MLHNKVAKSQAKPSQAKPSQASLIRRAHANITDAGSKITKVTRSQHDAKVMQYYNTNYNN
jgi:hypothetical protein